MFLLYFVNVCYAQLDVQITGGDFTVCKNDKVSLSHSVNSGSPTSFSWKSSVAIFSSPTLGVTQATILDSGIVILSVSDGHISFSDTIQINAKPLPEIKLGSNESICCDAGQLVLNFKIEEPKGVPPTGSWNCAEFPSLVKNNLFDVDSACKQINNALDNRAFQAVYTYQEPFTGCHNSDSIEITVNKNPTLILDGVFKCQDAGSFRLDEAVISPSNTSLGSPSWKCIECNGNDFEKDMLEDRGPGAFSDFWLNVNAPNYTMKNHDKDTIILEFTYINQYGCRAKDTTNVQVWRVPQLKFSRNRDLCFDEGKVSLNSLTGVNISGGWWSCYDSIGFESCTNLGGVNNDTINTYNSIDDAAAHTWMMRYIHNATGCHAEKFIPITVNPLPSINITSFDYEEFCETSPAVALNAAPAGGTWYNPKDPASIIVNSQYSPSSAQVFDQYTTIIYNYTSPITGCSNIDSIRARTDRAPEITPINDTTFCTQKGQTSIDLVYNLEAANSNNITWFAINPKATVSPYSATEDEILTLKLQNESSDTFRIILFAEALSLNCNTVHDFFDVIVHPTPAARILKSLTSGCNPLTTDLGVKINNQVSLLTSTYHWDFGDGESATSQTPSTTFTSDGINKFNVKVTSEHGCDTTLNSSVDVYPIPVAQFTPNPNNNAPLRSPRFVFKNTCLVSNTFQSSITNYAWDFGEISSTVDTSTQTSPGYIYPTKKATYQVVLQAITNYGCVGNYSYPVHVGKPEAVSISEINDEIELVIYPNPSMGSFRIESEIEYDLIITNGLGQKVPFSQEDEDIHIAERGLYILSVYDKKGAYKSSKRIIIK